MRNYLLCLLFLCWCQILPAQKIPGEIIVQFETGFSPKQFSQQLSVNPAEALLLSKSWNIWLLYVSEGDENKFINAIQKFPKVKVAQANHKISKRVAVPNDTLFPNQWSLENTGQWQGNPDADIDAPEAWELSTRGITALGDTIVVAVVDEGFDLQHEDLKFWKNENDPHNGFDDDLNGYIDDYDGWNADSHTDSIPIDFHGTHIAGIIAASGNNQTGITGVAWNARILPVCISDYTEAQVVEAYTYVFDQRRNYNLSGGTVGAFIIAANSSFGIDFGKPEDYPLWTAMYDSLGSVGILSVGSTMNITTDVEEAGDIPSTCPSEHLIIATNTTRYDQKSTSAAFGKESVDLGAPGTTILSTTPGNSYFNSSGTSMSAPHVAGAVAMMYSVACEDFMLAYHNKPDSLSLVVKDYILRGTDILNDLDGLTVSGGRLNLYNSMNSFYNDYCVSCLALNVTLKQVSCYGDSIGEIALTPSLGTPPYIYEWSTGDSSSFLDGLGRGKYSVRVSDNGGCEKYGYYEITQPLLLVVNLISDSAVNGENGSAKAFVSGGTPPYSFLWDDAAQSTDSVLENLPPGIYTVTVSDSNGCQAVNFVVVEDFVGINLVKKNSSKISVYPNPVGFVAQVQIKPSSGMSSELYLFDVAGKILLQKNFVGEETEIDFSKLQSGYYLLRIKNEETVSTKKVIKR